MDKLRKIFVVALICLVVSTIAVYALTSWTKTFTWSADFQVYHEDKSTTWAAGTEDRGISGQKNFWVVNQGTIQITVSVLSEQKENCTVIWLPLSSQTIQAHEGTWFNVTITPDLNPAGYYTFEFKKTG